MERADIVLLLTPAFPKAHTNASLDHFAKMITAYHEGNYEVCIGKAGKFIEAALKSLAVAANVPFLTGRQFKADKVMNDLGQLPAGSVSDSIRITIPRACRFVYDIASNRGARHDPHEVNPNQMDANAVVMCCSWIVGEMLRHATKNTDLSQAQSLVDSLTTRKYPFIEDIDGRVYFNLPKKPKSSALDIGFLALSHAYPGRLSPLEVMAVIKRHRFKPANAAVAVQRLKPFVDEDDNGGLKLRAPGMQKADEIRKRSSPKL